MDKKYFFVWEPEKLKQNQMYNAFSKVINEKNLQEKAEVIKSLFLGLTADTPVVKIMPEGNIYKGFAESDVET
nr:hypothetical protein [Candidatus Goldiibacteriota bacterium]